MLIFVGLLAVVLLALLAFGVAIAVITWFVLKALLIGMTIGLAIGGGLLGYAIFHNESGVIVGAMLAIVGGFAGLSYLGKRIERQGDSERPTRQWVEDRPEAIARSTLTEDARTIARRQQNLKALGLKERPRKRQK